MTVTQAQPVRPSTPRRRPAPRRGLAAAVLLVVAGALGGTGCATNRAPSARFVQQADQLHAEALASTVTPDDDLNEYVQVIGRRLEKAAREETPDKARGPFFQNMRFYVVDSPVINVFTTGGSHVYVYRGLFDFCNSEEELAAAMAHAYAHALNLDAETTGMNPPERPRPLRQVVWDYVVNRFDAQHEGESDKLAFRLYARAGWDPRGSRCCSPDSATGSPAPPPPTASRSPPAAAWRAG
jgi:hypothetical protein